MVDKHVFSPNVYTSSSPNNPFGSTNISSETSKWHVASAADIKQGLKKTLFKKPKCADKFLKTSRSNRDAYFDSINLTAWCKKHFEAFFNSSNALVSSSDIIFMMQMRFNRNSNSHVSKEFQD